jgi:protein-disulfide isomerase
LLYEKIQQSLEEPMGKRDTVKKHRNQQKKQDLWVILIISILAIAIIGVIVISKLPKPTATLQIAAKPNENGLNIGDPNAPVKVVEFADFQCPYCQLYWKELEPTIISKYVATGKVYYTYSPMAFLGQESTDATVAAYCANDQGKFWEYRDYIFTNHTGENVGDYPQTKLLDFANKLKLNIDTFKSCLASADSLKKVDDANAYASSQGVNSTPSFLVNGKVYSAGDFQQAIDNALAGK